MSVEIRPVDGIGEVARGDDVAALIAAATDLRDGDVVVVASKIVSKAEGRTVAVAAAETAEQARRRLALTDPTASTEVLVETPGVVVVRTPHGFVCANAGIDASNAPDGLVLLPADPDASAASLRARLADVAGADVGVVVADTFGRAWREGQTDVALGVAGIPALRDERGGIDRHGRPLQVTLVAVADQIAGAADLIRDKAAGLPVVVLRGLELVGGAGTGAELVRARDADLFPHGRGWLVRRLATGEGPATRPGPPSAREWALVARCAGTEPPPRGAGAITVADGLGAGRAEAALLDLGYDVEVRGGGAGAWTVTVS